MGTLLLWELFVGINIGVLWCMWILMREAYRHASWHIAARRDRRRWTQDEPELELPADFRIVPVTRQVGAPEPVVVQLRRAG